MRVSTICVALAAFVFPLAAQTSKPSPWVVYEPAGEGPGNGKHIVFVTGDEEYRSEEGMPALGKILAKHHGFQCTVLFSIHKKSGAIDPTTLDNIPGLEALESADLMVIFTRFRDLPDDQMKRVIDYVESGRPVIGLRTATHAFRFKKNKTYAKYGWGKAEKSKGGFGRQVLGERWVAHHGHHGRESARGIPAPGQEKHPILTGIAPKTIWDPADVYTVRLPMLDGIEPIVMGQVLAGMEPDSPVLQPKEGKKDKNDPMMPLAWIREWPAKNGTSRVFASTMGSAPAFTQEGSRRLLVNAVYWCLEMEKHIDAKSCVDLVGDFEPTMFGFNREKKGVMPASHRMGKTGGREKK